MIAFMTLADGVVLGSPEEVHNGAINHFKNFLCGVRVYQQADLSLLVRLVISV